MEKALRPLLKEELPVTCDESVEPLVCCAVRLVGGIVEERNGFAMKAELVEEFQLLNACGAPEGSATGGSFSASDAPKDDEGWKGLIVLPPKPVL